MADFQVRYALLLTQIRRTRFQLQALYKDPATTSPAVRDIYRTRLAPALAELDQLRMEARVRVRDALGPVGRETIVHQWPAFFAATWFTKPKMPVVEAKVKP